ncbi:hypothetical protein CYMTET_10426 [Cymbomonas tetramitiformis]|uniref:Methyltransferase FkbM domain-containing protein n=1 Tax=Cymbomonas tetramitiformis TaxID=36881 RepID=A0AAE0GPD1_9CHLO|nr:hypothetical protein CYMTET_10426 [Cymbomonas tetramitiformis]
MKKTTAFDRTLPPNRLFLGQYQQDWALYFAAFRHYWSIRGSDTTARPVYVDLAAAWPTKISNTFVFDACLGWSGICIEADPAKVPDLVRERGCQLIDTCIHSEDGFPVDFASSRDSGRNGIVSGPSAHSVQLNCTTLAKVFHRASVTQVEFLSLDVEGSEAVVLQGIDFTKPVPQYHMRFVQLKCWSRGKREQG